MVADGLAVAGGGANAVALALGAAEAREFAVALAVDFAAAVVVAMGAMGSTGAGEHATSSSKGRVCFIGGPRRGDESRWD